MAPQLFVVYGTDNDSYAFRDYPKLTENQRVHQQIVPDMSGDSRPGLRRCEECGGLLDKWSEPLNGLKVRKRRLDISCTYDGICIVSKRFKDVVELNVLTGLEFIPLPDDEDFYSIQARHIVRIDHERSMTRFVKKCPSCGIYESVVGPYTVLRGGETIPLHGFVRTDLEFASDDEKHPLILCGRESAQVLSKADLKGLELVPLDEP